MLWSGGRIALGVLDELVALLAFDEPVVSGVDSCARSGSAQKLRRMARMDSGFMAVISGILQRFRLKSNARRGEVNFG